MIVKNAAGEKREIVFHFFFPANQKQIARVLNFVSDNTAKRDAYFGIMMRYLTRRYIACDYEIETLYAEREAKSHKLRSVRKAQAEREAKSHKLRSVRKAQAELRKSWWTTNSATCEKFAALEDTAKRIKMRQTEITAEINEAKHLKERLKLNIQTMPEVKPW